MYLEMISPHGEHTTSYLHNRWTEPFATLGVYFIAILECI